MKQNDNDKTHPTEKKFRYIYFIGYFIEEHKSKKMFDEILKAVKDHFADNPQLAAAIPAEQHDAVHNEIATHIANNLQNPTSAPVESADSGGMSSILG